jgi:hypothetical protein
MLSSLSMVECSLERSQSNSGGTLFLYVAIVKTMPYFLRSFVHLQLMSCPVELSFPCDVETP